MILLFYNFQVYNIFNVTPVTKYTRFFYISNHTGNNTHYIYVYLVEFFKCKVYFLKIMLHHSQEYICQMYVPFLWLFKLWHCIHIQTHTYSVIVTYHFHYH